MVKFSKKGRKILFNSLYWNISKCVCSVLTGLVAESAMNKETKFKHQSPYWLLVLIAVLLAVIASSIVYEYRSRQEEYLHLLEEQARLFITALSGTAQQAMVASQEMEAVLDRQVFNHLHLLDGLDQKGMLNRDMLRLALDAKGIAAVMVYNARGEQQLAVVDSSFSGYSLSPEWVRHLATELSGDTLVSMYEPMLDEQEQIAALIPRSKGGILCALIGTEAIQSVRSGVGIGHFLKQFQAGQQVEYVVIQNPYAILAGSFGNYTLSTFKQDTTIRHVMEQNHPHFRVLTYGKTPVFEAASPFFMGSRSVGVLRLGLAMNDFQHLRNSMNRRLFIMASILIVTGILFASVLSNYRLRRMLHRELNDLSDYTYTVLENLMSGVVSVDVSRQVKTINRQGARLLSLESEVPLSASSLPDPLPGLIDQVLSSPDRIPDSIVMPLMLETGRITLQVRASSIRGEDGQITCVLLLDDITHQARLEAEMKRNQRLMAMRDLAASVAHEIKNPLNAIHLLVELIRKKMGAESPEQEHIRTIQGEIARISTIVDQYLQWARPPKLNRQKFNIADLVQDVAYLFQPEFEGHVEISSQVEDTFLEADSDKLKQVLINVIKNSGEAIAPQGTIDITGRKVGSCYELRISDTGHGISEENLSHIFDFYFSTKKGGSGIGLPVVQQIVAAHKGQLDVESREGQGTTIIIHLPLDQPACDPIVS